LFFATTDVGNCYRWNATTGAWEGLMNWVPPSQWNNSACGNIAVDPNDATGNILYATVGKYANYTYSWAPEGKVIKSTDRGNTWTDAGLPLWVSANGSDKDGGDRLGVDPQNSAVVYVTSYANGTYRGTNYGTSWTQINNLNGRFIAFDVSHGTVNGVTKNIFIGTSAGVYLSTDGGSTFALTGSSTVDARRATINNDGTMYVATTAGVLKWNGTSWSSVSPISGAYHGISVDPNNSNNVVASVSSWDSPTYLSNNGGASWTQFPSSYDVTEVPYVTGDHYAKGITDFAWDPFNTGHVWFSDIFNIWQTTNIWASTVAWKAQVIGEEEFVTTGTLMCPPTDRPNMLLSSGADLGGFDHKLLTSSPTVSMTQFFPYVNSRNQNGNMTGVAVEETNPNFIVRVGRHGWNGSAYAGYSTNGGQGYTIFSNYPTGESGGRVAVSANSQAIVWATQGGYTYLSTDLGSSWTKITSLPVSVVPGTNIFDGSYPEPLAADKVNGNKFYVYNAGKMYVSTGGGATFAIGATLPSISSTSLLQVATSPGIEGDIWVSLQGSGLFHSTDSGASFTQIANVQDAELMSVGMAATTTPAVYVMGKVGNIADGVFRSDDAGSTWTEIDTTAYKMGDEANTMAADLSVYGRVMIGTNGDGIFVYGDPSALPPTTTTTCSTATMHVDSINAYPSAKSCAQGVATVVIKDFCGNPVAGATVTGNFSSNGAIASGTTDSNASVTLYSGGCNSNLKGTFCVTNVTDPTLTYNSANNVVTCATY